MPGSSKTVWMPTNRAMKANGVRRRVLAGAVVVGMASAVVFGAVAGAATKVSAEEYAEAICGQVAAFADRADQLSATLTQAAEAFKAEPSQTTATAVRQALFDLLEQSAQGIDQITVSTEAIGIPDVRRGAQFARAVDVNFNLAADAFHALAGSAATIDLSSATAFADDFETVVDKVETMTKRLNKQAKRTPGVKNPSAALQPLVVFMTTDAERCPV